MDTNLSTAPAPRFSERRSRRLINQLAQIEATRRYQEARCALAVEFHTAELSGCIETLVAAWLQRLNSKSAGACTTNRRTEA
jgi:hypothetical protein